jgi:hypothetical protein
VQVVQERCRGGAGDAGTVQATCTICTSASMISGVGRCRRCRHTSDSCGAGCGHQTPAKTNRSECWCFPRSRHHEPLPLTSVTIPRWAHTCCSWAEPVHHSFLALSRAFFGTSYLTLPALLIPIGRSVLFLGAAPTEPPKKATQPERSTGRCRSTATGSATSAFVFSQLLGLGSAKIDNPELPSPSSALSVVAVVLVAGLVVFGEACLCV